LIDLPVCRFDLPPQHLRCLRNLGFGQPSIQLKHLIDKADDLVVPGDISGIAQVDGADGKLLNISYFQPVETTLNFIADMCKKKPHVFTGLSEIIYRAAPICLNNSKLHPIHP